MSPYRQEVTRIKEITVTLTTAELLEILQRHGCAERGAVVMANNNILVKSLRVQWQEKEKIDA